MTNVDKFWEALEALTYAETLEVAAQLRDCWDGNGYDATDAYDFAALLNNAREAAQLDEDA